MKTERWSLRLRGEDEMPGTLAATLESGCRARSRWLVLSVLCAGMLMVVLDTTAVNVALPAIHGDLGFSQPGLAWVVNAYLISFGSLLLLAGRLGDLLSRRTVFLAGLAVFTAASLACGLAQDQQALVCARFVQGVGGAMLSAVGLGMVVTLFPEAAARARAIGVYSFVPTAGGSVGLVAGGALTQSAGWHWVFFVNVPIGAALVVAGGRWLARDAGLGLGGGADFAGAALITAALMLGVYAIAGPAAQAGLAAPRTVAFAATAVAALAAFVAREATASDPLIPLSVFRSRDVAAANLIQALLTAGMFGFFFTGALYLRLVLGYNPLEIGLAFLPMTIVVAMVSLRYATGLILRYGTAITLLPGLGLVAVGLLVFAHAPVHGHYLPDVLPVMLVLGTGVGLAFPAVMALAMFSATERDAGLASGLINTTVQVGGALGLAVLAALAASRTSSMRGAGDPLRRALTGGYHLAATIGVGWFSPPSPSPADFFSRPGRLERQLPANRSAHTQLNATARRKPDRATPCRTARTAGSHKSPATCWREVDLAVLSTLTPSRQIPTVRKFGPVTSQPRRFQMKTAISADGTAIAFDQFGGGPPVIMAAGAFNTRAATEPLARALEQRFTVLNYDRRGRGDSGDTAPYAIDREVEDLGALITAAGGSASVFGYSSGAILALRAAAAGLPITHLLLYEPPFRPDDSYPAPPADLAEQVTRLVAAGRRGDAVELYQIKAIGIPEDVVAQMRHAPFRPGLDAIAHTLVYEAMICGDLSLPAGLLASIAIPALVICGEQSPPMLRAAARAVAETLPSGRLCSLAGQTHDISPQATAPVIADFLTS